MRLQVTVVYAPAAGAVREIPLQLPPGTSVQQALQASQVQALFPELDLQTSVIGVWGRKAAPDQILRDRDRLEIYRPLKVDPKVARRERFAKQGAKTAGLFANKRSGAKAGY